MTDPLCPGSWGLEPVVGPLAEHGRVRLVMGGLARVLGSPAAAEPLVRRWLEEAARSGMPFDPRIWWEGAPRSSFPACLAVKAAGEQDLDAALLRRLRVGSMARRIKLDTTEALVEEARQVAGMDVERFRIDLASNATVEAFGADLERAGEHRERMPALLDAAGAEVDPATLGRPEPLDVDTALTRHGPLAAVEVAARCGLPVPGAEAELWRRATEWRARPERCGTAVLWYAA